MNLALEYVTKVIKACERANSEIKTKLSLSELCPSNFLVNVVKCATGSVESLVDVLMIRFVDIVNTIMGGCQQR